MKFILAMLVVLLSAHAYAQTYTYFGTNFSGGEFGDIGRAYGSGYIYPDANEVAYFAKKGMKIGRLPFKWERVQPTLGGDLDSAEIGRIRNFLDGAQASRMKILVDMHNYGQYQNIVAGWKSYIGTANVPQSAYADVWAKLAKALGDHPALLGYDIMNEPEGFSDGITWPNAAQAAVDAIRQVDNKTAIYVEGDCWASAANWPNCGARSKVTGTNIVYEAHQYLDASASGNYDGKTYDGEGATPTTGVERVTPFVNWCNAQGVQCFVGEYGVPGNDSRWLDSQENMIKYLAANSISGTWWSSGPWWGDYILSIEPNNGVDKPQMAMLAKYVAVAQPAPVPTPAPTPVDGLVDGSLVTIVNSAANLCLDDAGASTQAGSSIIQWNCHGGLNQKFKVSRNSDSSYTLINQASNMCLDVNAASKDVGAKLQQWDCNGTGAQKFSAVSVGNKHFRLINTNSQMCLDDPAQSHDPGTQYQQYTCNGTVAQDFLIQ